MSEDHHSLSDVLDAVRRRAVIDNLNRLATLGWYLSHPTTGALADPADLARRLQEGNNDLLVGIGLRGNVVPSPASDPEEGHRGSHHDQDESVPGVRQARTLAPGTA